MKSINTSLTVVRSDRPGVWLVTADFELGDMQRLTFTVAMPRSDGSVVHIQHEALKMAHTLLSDMVASAP